MQHETVHVKIDCLKSLAAKAQKLRSGPVASQYQHLGPPRSSTKVVVEVLTNTPDKVDRELKAASLLQLETILADPIITALEDPKSSGKVWLKVQFSASGQAAGQTPTLTLGEAMNALKAKLALPSLAVKDTLTSSPNVKVDRYPNCVYSAILGFSNEDHGEAESAIRGKPSESTSRPPLLKTASSKRPLLDLIPRSQALSTEEMHEYLERCLPRSNPGKNVHYHRSCFFLMRRALVSICEKEKCVDEISQLYRATDVVQDERDKNTCFLYYRLLEGLVLQSREILKPYYDEILRLEGSPFQKHSVWTLAKDEAQTKELHLIARDLRLLKHQMAPMLRGLSSLQQLSHDKDLIDDETVDFLEEVVDEVAGTVDDVDVLTTAAQSLTELMFGLTSYRSTVSTQLLTGVSMVFLPLTWIVGIYGTNFAILPELTWGIRGDDGQPDGWAGGYLYLWCIMLFSGLFSLMAMIRLEIF